MVSFGLGNPFTVGFGEAIERFQNFSLRVTECPSEVVPKMCSRVWNVPWWCRFPWRLLTYFTSQKISGRRVFTPSSTLHFAKLLQRRPDARRVPYYDIWARSGDKYFCAKACTSDALTEFTFTGYRSQ